MITIHLIDALPYVFRAYFSLPTTMKSPGGQAINAAYGYCAFLLDLLNREQPTHIAAAFDGSLTSSFRNEIYPDYKAQREQPDEDLRVQLEACWQITEALGIQCYIDDRYEADDIIGTIVAKLQRSDRRFIVLSNDKDLSQLVDRRTTFWDYAKDRRLDPAGVKEHFGVRPNQIVDLLALMGDKVDNIPGVPGIGPKTAVALLQEFDGLDSILTQIDQVASLSIRGAAGIAKKLEQFQEQARLSKQLASIATNAPIRASVRALQYRGVVQSEILPLFDQLGFGRIRDRLPQKKT